MTGEEIAKALGVHYDGIQEGFGFAPDHFQFTDRAGTGSSFNARTLEEAGDKLAAMRRMYELKTCQIAFTAEDLEQAAKALEVDPADYPALLEGMEHEKEHADFTECDPVASARIALAHLNEHQDYYKKLKEAGL